MFSQFENLPTVSSGRKFYLSWSHYLKLMRIDNIDERHFYEIFASKYETVLPSKEALQKLLEEQPSDENENTM